MANGFPPVNKQGGALEPGWRLEAGAKMSEVRRSHNESG